MKSFFKAFFIIVIFNFMNVVNTFSQTQTVLGYDDLTGSWSFGNQSNPYQSPMFQWQFLQTPLNTQILDVFFASANTGYATYSSMGILITTNGGTSWTDYSFNDTNFTTSFTSIHFINPNTGWTVGGATQIRKTTNAGLNWSRQIPPPGEGIFRSVYFINENTGYICGSKGFPLLPYIVKTTNGGSNWTELPVSIPSGRELNDMHWFDASTGWICGYNALLYTTNGGVNFTNLFSNIPPSGNGNNNLYTLDFVNAQTGWIGAANIDRRNLYKTTNSGVNWTFQDNPIFQGGMNLISDVMFINPDSGWAIHGTPNLGVIMFTSDQGANWTIEEQSPNDFRSLTYADNKVYCGASGGKIWFKDLVIGISSGSTEYPGDFYLSQNYPNPFNPSTIISYSIPKTSLVKLTVYDLLGKEVMNLINGNKPAGNYTVEFNANDLTSGVYYYRLEAENFISTKKMLLLK